MTIRIGNNSIGDLYVGNNPVSKLYQGVNQIYVNLAPAVTPSPGLFFALAPNASSRLTTAHYFGPYPRSINNTSTRSSDSYTTNFLNPDNPTYIASRGWHENRPIFRSQQSGNWQVEDCKFDILAAQAHGIDVFFCDLLGMSGSNFDNYNRLVQAAEELDTGFLVAPMLDGNGAHSTSGGNIVNPVTAAASIAGSYWNKTCTWTLDDGSFVLSSFKGEARDVQWWTDLINALKNNHGIPKVAFMMGFLDYSKASLYSSITMGEGSWGSGDDPAIINNGSNQTAAAHGRGKVYCMPIGGGQIRRPSGLFDETLNTEGLRAAWAKAISQGTDYVQLVTWSDYSEGAEHAPSEARGYTHLILDAYYGQWWKTGTAPTILRDEIIISHRQSRRDATPQKESTKHLNQWTGAGRGGPFSTVRNAVEILTFLTAPDTVMVTIGGQDYSYAAPAGMYAQTYSMAVGTVEASITRGTSLTMFAPITDSPTRENAVYLAASAIRGTAGQRVPV